MASVALASLLTLVGLICAASPTVVESRQRDAVIDEWIRIHSQVFDKTGRALDESQVLSKMAFLHREIGPLREITGSATRRMVDSVDFVYAALSDTDVEHCTVQHLDHVQKQLSRRIRDPLDGNLMILLSMAHRNLVELCGDLHLNVPQVLNTELDDSIRLRLRNLKLTHEDLQRGGVTKKKLRYWILREIQIDDSKSTEQEILDAWDAGPCWKLYSALDRRGLQSFHEFSKLDFYLGPSAANKCRPTIEFWVRTIRACDQLELIITDVAVREPEPGINAPNQKKPQRKRDRFAKALSSAPRHLIHRAHIRAST